MVRINRNELEPNELFQLLERFDNALAERSKAHTTHLLNELLGPEERLTLAKRLIAIILMYEGYTEYRTSSALKLSHSTTKIIADRLKSGAYDTIIDLLTKKKMDYADLLTGIMSVLHLGGILPQRVGLDRYRTYEERRAQYTARRTRRKP